MRQETTVRPSDYVSTCIALPRRRGVRDCCSTAHGGGLDGLRDLRHATASDRSCFPDRQRPPGRYRTDRRRLGNDRGRRCASAVRLDCRRRVLAGREPNGLGNRRTGLRGSEAEGSRQVASGSVTASSFAGRGRASGTWAASFTSVAASLARAFAHVRADRHARYGVRSRRASRGSPGARSRRKRALRRRRFSPGTHFDPRTDHALLHATTERHPSHQLRTAGETPGT